ncbi:hypothetical protein FRX31_027095 [Thalictrum thalictroides]|uniref:Uncharacterized protein n=1 Tax=Thalictrum thalictroides TaxID=46969 RepID=A0A7J6VEJ3_THATH|nr:hypothetical protein FRX31_027095 [Thalictrum thalictroides]
MIVDTKLNASSLIIVKSLGNMLPATKSSIINHRQESRQHDVCNYPVGKYHPDQNISPCMIKH